MSKPIPDAMLPFANLLAGAALAACAAAAQAQTITAVNGSGVPGGSASVAFDFDFDSGVEIDAFSFTLDWNPALLTPAGGSATYHGVPVDAAAALAGAGMFEVFDNSAAGSVSATWYALDQNFNSLDPLALTGSARLQLDFVLAPGFPAGSTASVALGFEPTYHDGSSAGLGATATITAVPEPQTWAMWLAAGVGLAGWMRRRRALGHA